MSKQVSQPPGSSRELAQIKRKNTIPVKVGSLTIGGGSPVVVQEMTTSFTSDIEHTVEQIHQLEWMGCRLVRVSVPDEKSARAIKQINSRTEAAIVADIHFDYRLAVMAAENGADKLRLNPGNIGSEKKVSMVVDCARHRGIPIRVGVNSGSLRRDVIEKYGGAGSDAMVESALREVTVLEKNHFYDIVVSVKSPDIVLTVESNRKLSDKLSYPLHLGITEAGYGDAGMMRSAAGLGVLLLDGIGDTIRTSITSVDRSHNIKLCQDLLKNLGIPYC
ncbi:MAG: (E)-4-hydroxy-3-methylbut-2-enyl-diphosphate synthase [Spirochaetota bacterium]